MTEYVPNPLIEAQAHEGRKRICVVGGGANGLGTLKVFADTPQVKEGLWSIVAFEERDNVGGIWLPAPPVDNPPLTPLYDSLDTNIPHLVMSYASYPFPPGSALYPPATKVQEYLEAYADHFDLRKYVRLQTRVEEAIWDKEGQVWKVRLSTGERADYEFLVVANGHYRDPRLPDTQGLQAWLDSGRAIHSAWFRRPSDYAQHKRVLVVGGGPSAIDISSDMRSVAELVLQSMPPGMIVAKPDGFGYPVDAEDFRKKTLVSEYKDNGEIVFEDGTVETAIDFVILATGYKYSYPFLTQIINAIPPVPPPLPTHLYNSMFNIFPLAKHLFPLQTDFPPHAIAFPGLLYRVAPFPLFEDQARAVIRVLEDPSALDVAAEAVALVSRAQELTQRTGTDDPESIAKAWFKFTPHEPWAYRKELNEFAQPGTEWRYPDWEIEIWDRKVDLRAEWRALVSSGEAEDWVRGVGEGGVLEWVELCRKILKRYDERVGQSSKL